MGKRLSFGDLRGVLADAFGKLPDARRGANRQYTMADAAWAAFSVFFMQSPSFLAHQRDMQRHQGVNNAQTLFGVTDIPTDPQIRNLLDPVDPAALREPFWGMLERALGDGEVAARFGGERGWLVSLDGTQYFGSHTIHCPQCSRTEREEGTLYTHTALVPVLGSRTGGEVLALEPEFITPQDGVGKQDCELRAAERWVRRNGGRLASRPTTVLGDDLYCHQPFCELLLAQGLDFILTCKPSSHPTLYEEVGLLDKMGAVGEGEERHWTGRHYETWRYRYAERVPLREPPRQLYVNWCELTVQREGSGEVLYHNAWATNRPLSAETVAGVAADGRRRWQVENEGYNVLKQHGYHLEHNFGHGQAHLAAVLVMLILLAFLWHTILGVVDAGYRRVREELGARRTFFEDLRALTRYLVFPDWETLLGFMSKGLDLVPG